MLAKAGFCVVWGAFLLFAPHAFSLSARTLKCHQTLIEREAQLALTRATLDEDTFTVGRSLDEVDFTMSGELSAFLEDRAHRRLQVRWADWGAGLARPQRDFIRLNGYFPGIPKLALDCHAIAKQIPRFDDYTTPEKKVHVRRLRKAIRDGVLAYTEADLNLPLDLGKTFNLGTDFLGALSYSEDLSQTLRTILGSLERFGKLFVHTTNYSAIIEVGKRQLDLAQFLSSIPGLKVKLLRSRHFGRDVVLGDLFELNFIVTKLRTTVEIPDLQSNEWLDDVPPLRRYILSKATFLGTNR